MTTAPYWYDATSTLYVGDARDVLAAMPDGSADCIVTSPPYWGKRDYGVAGQYGHEPDPAGYVATLRAVFTEARRVLADDGTCWLNLGRRAKRSSSASSARSIRTASCRLTNAAAAPSTPDAPTCSAWPRGRSTRAR
jgi:DNA modification methylase